MSFAMKGHGSKFSRKKEDAILALCTHRTVEEAARAANVSKRTLVRWMKLPEFKKEYMAARREAVSQSNARMQQASGAAVSTLVKIMVDATAPPSARVRAADRILHGARQAIVLEDIEVRITDLERSRDKEKT